MEKRFRGDPPCDAPLPPDRNLDAHRSVDKTSQKESAPKHFPPEMLNQKLFGVMWLGWLFTKPAQTPLPQRTIKRTAQNILRSVRFLFS